MSINSKPDLTKKEKALGFVLCSITLAGAVGIPAMMIKANHEHEAAMSLKRAKTELTQHPLPATKPLNICAALESGDTCLKPLNNANNFCASALMKQKFRRNKTY